MVKLSVMITCRQLKAARHLAGLNQAELAELGGLSSNTVAKVEGKTGGRYVTVSKVIAALEHAGIKFEHNGVAISGTVITRGNLTDG
jgi:predicted transcriptional regulator